MTPVILGGTACVEARYPGTRQKPSCRMAGSVQSPPPSTAVGRAAPMVEPCKGSVVLRVFDRTPWAPGAPEQRGEMNAAS